MKKKGISAVVATVLIILITVAAVTLVWQAIIPMIKDNLDFSALEGRVEVVTSGGYTFYDSIAEMASVQIKRGMDNVEMNRIKIIFSIGGSSTASLVIAPEPGNTKTYVFDMSEYGEPDSVSVSPIFSIEEKEKEGSITSKVNIGNGEVVTSGLIYDAGRDYAKGSSCKAVLDAGKSTGDGLYIIKVDGKSPFEAYCDMTTDGGGWTLVLLSNRDPALCPSGTWEEAINQVNYNGGSISEDIASFDLLLGLSYWDAIGSNMRVEVGANPSSIQHRAYADFYLDENDNYKLRLSNAQIDIGGSAPGIFSYHNNRPFSTKDADNDANGGSCSSYYNDASWWYGSCWSGSFWGGCGSGYQDTPFWTSSGSAYFDHGSIWVR